MVNTSQFIRWLIVEGLHVEAGSTHLVATTVATVTVVTPSVDVQKALASEAELVKHLYKLSATQPVGTARASRPTGLAVMLPASIRPVANSEKDFISANLIQYYRMME
jgi:hypothetical protein